MRSTLLLLICLGLLTTLPFAAPASAAGPSVTTVPLRSAQAGRDTIGYRSLGSGRPLVMIMGLSGTADSWPPALLDALAATHRVIVFDNAGIRRTSAGKGKLTIKRMADVAAELIGALKLKRPDVLGWSMGGTIAQSLAVRYPKLVRRLVLCATAPGDGKATFPTAETVRLLGGTDVGALLGLLFPPGHDADNQAYVSGILSYPSPLPQAPAAVVKAQFAATASWLGGADPAGKLVRKLKIPVYAGGGDADQVLPVANMRHLASIVKGSTLSIYPGAAHAFFIQDQPRFLGEMARFLG